MRTTAVAFAFAAAACTREAPLPPDAASSPADLRTVAAEPPTVPTAPMQPTSATVAQAEDPWSGWGEWVAGVRIRARVPSKVLRGDELHPLFEVEFDAKAAESGTTHFVVNEFGVRTWLVCTDRRTGRVVNVEPFDVHMPNFASEEDRFLLTGPPPPQVWATYYLSTVWDELPPGDYDARLEFRDPRDRPRRASDQVDWQPPRVWTGTVSTASFPFEVAEAPPETLHLEIPTRLTLRRSHDESWHAIDVSYRAADSVGLDAPVHHGFTVAVKYCRDGFEYGLSSPPPKPDDVNPIDRILPDHKGRFDAKYRIEVFECGEAPSHMWFPGPETKGWRVLWSGSFNVSATAAEIDALRK